MTDLNVATTTGSYVVLDDATMQAFKVSLRGKVFLPNDSGYDDARKLYNAMHDKKPAFIVQCAGVADVIAAIQLAATSRGPNEQLLTSVRGTGHNITGSAVCNGGMVIDLSHMKGLHVNVPERTVRAEPGLTWKELNHDLQAFGLQATGGYISSTGIGGLTLGGGLGWLIRKHGMACDNLLEVDVVTAKGELLKASTTQNADLFWAIRGGGGNFGIVTSFKFQVHPVERVLAGMVGHPATVEQRAKEATKSWRDFSETAPEAFSGGVALMTAPPAPFIPQELHGSAILAVAGVYCGEDLDEGKKVIRPLRECDRCPPVFDIFQPMPGKEAQSMFDASFPWGYRNYWKSSILQVVSDEAIDTVLSFFASVPSPLSVVVVEQNGHGAINRVSASETAVGHRNWSYDILICSMWTDANDDEKNIAWTREFWTAMQAFARDAVYVNYLGEEGADRIKSAYATETFERLSELKTKYDPTNFFRLNQNIKPAE